MEVSLAPFDPERNPVVNICTKWLRNHHPLSGGCTIWLRRVVNLAFGFMIKLLIQSKQIYLLHLGSQQYNVQLIEVVSWPCTYPLYYSFNITWVPISLNGPTVLTRLWIPSSLKSLKSLQDEGGVDYNNQLERTQPRIILLALGRSQPSHFVLWEVHPYTLYTVMAFL